MKIKNKIIFKKLVSNKKYNMFLLLFPISEI